MIIRNVRNPFSPIVKNISSGEIYAFKFTADIKILFFIVLSKEGQID